MKIEKLPSGSYRVRKTYNKKTYTVMFDHKPTAKEVMSSVSAAIDNDNMSQYAKDSFIKVASDYISIKEHVLSPASIREYTRILNRLPEDFTEKRLNEIDQLAVQRLIDNLSIPYIDDKGKTVKRSAKTIRDYHGFISSVLGLYNPSLSLKTTLPKKTAADPYIPTNEEVKAFLKEIKGTEFEIPVLLGIHGLRRSEICALTMDDIEGNVIHITKGLVQDKDKKWLVKAPKTVSSIRDVVVSDYVVNTIKEKGYIYNGFPGQISQAMKRIENKLGIKEFSLHKLRHYFASELSANNVDIETILSMGGWKTDYVMKNVYRHVREEKLKKAQEEASKRIASNLFDMS